MKVNNLKNLYDFYKQNVKDDIEYFKDREAIPFHFEYLGSLQRVLTLEQIIEDRNELFRLLESIHPLFLIEPPSEYLLGKAEYISTTNEPMNIDWFERATNHFLTSLNDKHTCLFFMRDDEYLQYVFHYYDGKLFYENECSPVKKIADINVTRIIQEIKYNFPCENKWMLKSNILLFAKSRRILQYCGIVSDNPEIELENGIKISCQWNEIIEKNSMTNMIKVKEDHCYIRFAQCECTNEWNDIIEILKSEIANGTRDIVVDIRGNGGGNNLACMNLLNAMGMEIKRFGVLMRFSKEAADQRGYVQETGFIADPIQGNFIENPNINLEIWLDENVFSSANMLAVWVKDGKLGKLRGVPSMNRPSHFGDAIQFQLPNSLAYGFISHKAFWRMDESLMFDDELIIDDSL